jgi:glucose/arabinose dehydrogenase
MRHLKITVATLALLCVATIGAGCAAGAASRFPAQGDAIPTSAPVAAAAVPPAAAAVTAVSGLGRITNIVAPDDGSGRLFVTDQVGIIRVVKDGALAATAALDIRSLVGSTGNEQGLLGLAFPPGFSGKQRAYIYFTDKGGTSRVYRIRVSAADPDAFDPASIQHILSIKQPYANHNGGQLAFGPKGYLYLGFGDGGGGGDPGNRAQNLGTLLGKILRIDVETSPTVSGYRIPPGNPFVRRAGARHEIWSYGLRNPWRFSFDPLTLDMWIADVGQYTWEEIDFVAGAKGGGHNFGWRLYEGNHLYRATAKRRGFMWPVSEYRHPYGEAVTGGYVYRGSAYPAAQGLYVFGDYVTGKIWTLKRSSTGWTRRLAKTTTWGISTFGVDGSGELWAADRNTGTIHLLGDMSK